jgi:hypothetical protein
VPEGQERKKSGKQDGENCGFHSVIIARGVGRVGSSVGIGSFAATLEAKLTLALDDTARSAEPLPALLADGFSRAERFI